MNFVPIKSSLPGSRIVLPDLRGDHVFIRLVAQWMKVMTDMTKKIKSEG